VSSVVDTSPQETQNTRNLKSFQGIEIVDVKKFVERVKTGK
jgi:hypothetical protein